MMCLASIFVAIALIVIFIIHEYVKRSYFTQLGIQCERTWPLLGALPTIMAKGILNHDQDGIRQHGKVYGSYLGTTPNIVVTDLRMIKEVLIRQFQNFPYRMKALYVSRWWENGVVIASGDHWKYLRTLLCPTFSSGKLRSMQPAISDCLAIMVDTLKCKSRKVADFQVDMRKHISALTMDIICQTSFGIQADTQSNMQSTFTKHAKTVSTLSIESSLVNVLPLIVPKIKCIFEFLGLDYVDIKALNYFKDLIKNLVSERQTSDIEYNDTLQHLMCAHKEDISSLKADLDELEFMDDKIAYLKARGLTEDELIANSLIVLMAGHDTTATTLTWMCYLLATNQHIQDNLIDVIDAELDGAEPTHDNVQNIEYLDNFLSETLRLYPAANRTGRDADVDTEVCGYKIPQGITITIPIYALHRMPEYWSDPDECIPERFSAENKHKILPYSFIPYGAGPRACIGIRLAQMLCKIIIVKLLQNFRLHATDDQEMPPALEKSLLTKPIHGMVLRVQPRHL